MENNEIIRDSFTDYVKALVALKEATNDLKYQMRATNKAVERVLTHTHLNALLTMTTQNEFVIKANV